MCQSRNSKKVLIDGKPKRVDGCLPNTLIFLNNEGLETVGSCCGHDRYPATVVIKSKKGYFFELYSSAILPRKKRFYVKDKNGFFFIPETVEVKHENDRKLRKK